MDITTILARLRTVTDAQLRSALQREHLSITSDKYTTAFSCFAVACDLNGLDLWITDSPRHISPEIDRLRRNGQRASIVFMVFTTLQYMRSEHLERGLDQVPVDSPLRPFRDFFRAGKKGEDTLAQHIRNSLGHGTFEFAQHEREVIFEDGRASWKISISFDDLWELCNQVHRLYQAAFASR